MIQAFRFSFLLFRRPCRPASRSLQGAGILFSLLAALSLFPSPGSAAPDFQPDRRPDPQIDDLTALSIEELMNVTVYGASKYRQEMQEAPSSVTVVTAAEIKRYGYRTLADLLRSVRGFYLTYDRIYHFAGVRGFARPGDYNTRILLLVDGHRINDIIFNQGLIGTDFPLDIDLIDRVEIIRGPSSSLYGTSAFFGVIDVITRSGGTIKGAEVSGEAGGYGAFKERASFGADRRPFQGLVSGSASRSGGKDLFFREFDSPATGDGVASGTDFDRNYSFFTRLSYHDLSLEGLFGSRTKGLPTAPYNAQFDNPDNRFRDERGFIELKYEKNFSEETGITGRVSYDLYRYRGTIVNADSLVTNQDKDDGAWWGGEIKLTFKPLSSHRATTGMEYQGAVRQQQKNYDADPYAVYLDDSRNTKVWAAYFQDEISLTSRLIANLGVRYDHYSDFGGTLNPRIALIYALCPDVTLKLLYGEAFRAPNVFELYYNDGGLSAKANPGLRPETVKTYEAILEKKGEEYRAALSAFFYRIRDIISLETDPSDGLLVYKNADQAKALGVEGELERKWRSGAAGKVSYSYQNARDDRTGEWLTNSPRHLFKANVILPLLPALLPDKVFGGVEAQYTGKRKARDDRHAGGYLLVNTTLFSSNIVKDLEFSASVYNLFGKKFQDPASEEHPEALIEQDGRNFRLKLTYRFF